jgi:hypothetical protein
LGCGYLAIIERSPFPAGSNRQFRNRQLAMMCGIISAEKSP